ncbi:MAG: GNAT family N-acetyltransferase [Chloroflexi bacterium]|nr:GNAT family N-acetyltransferase [Chloroflexota bacterium]MCC6895736.1 GNAT family N-acetyltransferase [Anaerolineae bacterium]
MQIDGNQIILRDWEMGDLKGYSHWLLPHHEWKQLDAPYYPGPGKDEIPELVNDLRFTIEVADWPEPRQQLIIADKASKVMIGQVSWYWISEETNWPAVGIVIYDPQHWRKGIGYEALGLWSDYLLQAQPLFVRLDLRTWSGNAGMMRLAEKVGYKEEARFRNARIVNGQYYDGMGYGILREEWAARYPLGFKAVLG